MKAVLRFLIAFLFNNDLLGNRLMRFKYCNASYAVGLWV